MDKDKSQVEQSGCGCDSTPGDDVCCTPGGGGKSNWRTALFIAVVVLAGGVAAHSVLTNGDSDMPCDGAAAVCASAQSNGNGGEAVCALEQSNGNGGEVCTKSEAAASGCCPSTASPAPTPEAPADCGAKKACPSTASPAPTPEAPASGCPSEAAAGCGEKEASDCPITAPPAPTPEAEAGCGSKEASSGCCGGH